MQWIDELRIETPEQIEVNLELAGLGSRFIAQLIDWLVKLALLFVLAMVVGIVASIIQFSIERWIDNASKMVSALLVVGLYLVLLSYGLFFEVWWNGQTPGKRAVGIRVICDNGSPVNFTAVGIRNFLALADFLPVLFILGSLLILISTRRQRLGDMAAGTVVIRERPGEHGIEPEDAIDEYASKKIRFANFQLANLTTTDRTILREFLRRCNGMEGRTGPRLARRLAKRYVAKTGYQLDRKRFRTGAIARKFLASLLRDLQEFIRNK